MVQDNTDFEDESFDLDELEDNSDASVIFLHDGTKIKQSNSISVKNTILLIQSFYLTKI